MPKRTESKLGEIRNNNFNTPMKIIEYINAGNIRVKILDEYGFEMDSTYQNFKEGKVRNPYDKTTYGVGYMGVGKYTCNPSNFGFFMYCVWRRMLNRCYNEKDREDNKTYEDCEACKEWHNYQNFAQWYEDNYYTVGKGRMHLDKDILIKDNKLYSPDTCLIVPQRINMIFMGKTNKWNLPSGISMSQTGKYITSYNTKHLGNLNTLEEAIAAHDKEKRIHIREVIESYGNKLPDKVVQALLAW